MTREPVVTLSVEFERETDGRWIADIPEIEHYLAASGQGGGSGLAATGTGVRFGRVQVVLHKLHDRKRSNTQIADEIIARSVQGW